MALRSLLGGAGISLAAHELLLLTGNTFGISGFVHRGVNGNSESLAGLAGLVLGGIVVATMERGATSVTLSISPSWLLLSGFLVGIGTKLANGCTSGHMICGISRRSLRSTVATATFFAAAAVSANLFHGDFMGPGPSSLSRELLSNKDTRILFLQGIPLLAVTGLYLINPKVNVPVHILGPLRDLTYFITSVQFAFALRLSDLTQSTRVLGFLLPFRKGFDPSLLFVAGSSVPLGILLYQSVYSLGRRSSVEKRAADAAEPRLGDSWVWKAAQSGIDIKLIGGCVIFGLGWGLTGICPGTGIVNVGRALGNGQIISPYAVWTAAMVVGGIIAGQMESKL